MTFLISQAYRIWVRFAVVNKNDRIPAASFETRSLLIDNKLAFLGEDGSLRASYSRKELKLMLDMENL